MTMDHPIAAPSTDAIPLVALSAADWPAYCDAQPEATRRWFEAHGFTAQPATWIGVPAADGSLTRVIAGVADPADVWSLAHLPGALPVGAYTLERGPSGLAPELAALGFVLGGYRFERYRPAKREPARLVIPAGVDGDTLKADADAIVFARNLINTPAEDLGPGELAEVAAGIAATHGAEFTEWSGDELLEQGFPSIHAVGRASPRAPRLLEISHGDPRHPRITLVGKGVCFDSGGLDLKPADGMRWMKKDMGGAAIALALGRRLIEAGLPVHLRILVPAVDNAVAGDALRPGDVIRTRAGHTVEIDNTDAEGRLILADALTYAAEAAPELIIDFATLTGAARIALGPDLPALFANDDALASGLLEAGAAVHDPLWRMPLWRGYRPMLDSHLADFANSGPSKHAGAILGALYLDRFVPETIPWAHLDVYCWNDVDRPGRPRGGEAQGLRAFQRYLERRYRRS
jgi:leucyl aminopeptidase